MAFQPKRPTRVPPVTCELSSGFGSEIGTIRGVPRMAAGSRLASVEKDESGNESTNPSPKRGVVKRPAKSVAPAAGLLSTPELQLRPPTLNPPIPKSCRSEPPVDASELNTPLEIVP